MTEQEQILKLREELHQHNYNYYVLNMPTISDKDFDMMMHQLQDLEKLHPEMATPNSPTQRVGSDLNNEFVTVQHKRPMLSLAARAAPYGRPRPRRWSAGCADASSG